MYMEGQPKIFSQVPPQYVAQPGPQTVFLVQGQGTHMQPQPQQTMQPQPQQMRAVYVANGAEQQPVLSPAQTVHFAQPAQPAQRGAHQPVVLSDDSLPPGWLAVLDAGTGRTYYWHVDSNSTSWTRPAPVPVPVPAQVPAQCSVQYVPSTTHPLLPHTQPQLLPHTQLPAFSHTQPPQNAFSYNTQAQLSPYASGNTSLGSNASLSLSHNGKTSLSQNQRSHTESQRIWTNYNDASFYASKPRTSLSRSSSSLYDLLDVSNGTSSNVTPMSSPVNANVYAQGPAFGNVAHYPGPPSVTSNVYVQQPVQQMQHRIVQQQPAPQQMQFVQIPMNFVM